MFANRVDAGEQLANILEGMSLPSSIVLLGIARGGVEVASVIAKRLHAPFGVVVVKKIGAPYNPELALGAVGEENVVFWDQEAVAKQNISEDVQSILADKTQKEVKRRVELFSKWYRRSEINGRTAFIVDDGVATGATAVCAALSAKAMGARDIFLITPVIPSSQVAVVRDYVAEIITLQAPENFTSVGQFYTYFPQLSDDDIKFLLSFEQYHSKD